MKPLKTCQLSHDSRREAVRRALWAVALLCLMSHFTRNLALAQGTLPDGPREVFESGVAAEKAGRLDAAEKAFLQVLRQGGDLPFVHNNLGTVYQQRGDHVRASEEFRKAIRQQPSYVAPHILLGASLLALKQVPAAARELQIAVKLDPRQPQAREQLAKACERADDWPGVVDQYRALREMAPQDPEYAYRLGHAYLRLAAWSFDKMRRISPRSARVFESYGEGYLAEGHPDEAIRAYRRAAQADPKLPGIHLALAEIYSQQNKPDDARREVEQELALVPESIDAKNLQQRLQARPPGP